jgi:hypothetical protein
VGSPTPRFPSASFRNFLLASLVLSKEAVTDTGLCVTPLEVRAEKGSNPFAARLIEVGAIFAH